MTAMRRTRKWAYVAQEAKRLADLGLDPIEIATRLEVNRSTVQRWMATGKLADTRRTAQERPPVVPGRAEGWAEAVRAAYALDPTDTELVALASQALAAATDPEHPVNLRLLAMGRFQALVKQLGLAVRTPLGEALPPPEPEPRPPLPSRASRPDPRGVLLQ